MSTVSAAPVRAHPFLRPRPVTDPAVRLVVFHHAGGSAAVYHPMVRRLPTDWDLLLMELPGRGTRPGDPLVDDMATLVEHVASALAPWADGRLALFGHSLGAALTSEVARRLEERGTPPRWIGVSGRIAPRHERRYRGRMHELDDARLLDEVQAMGGLPARVREMPEFVDRFLATVRADLRAVESYLPIPGRAPLGCPMGVFSGRDDDWAPPELMLDWACETTGEVRFHTFDGGHFYFRDDMFESLVDAVVDSLAAPVA